MTRSATLDPVLSHLDEVLDHGRLSDLVGRDVRATRLRVKPGTSVTCALLDPAGRPVGWLQVLAPALADKAEKRLRTATAEAPVRRLDRRNGDAEWIVITGGLTADPRLAKPLRRLPRSIPVAAVVDPDAVLRYNPLRRIVARVGGAVVRVSARPSGATGRDHQRLAAAGVPLLLPIELSPHVSSTPWFGTRDLAAVLGDPHADPSLDPHIDPHIDSDVDPGVDPGVDPDVDPHTEPSPDLRVLARRAGQLFAALHDVPVAPETVDRSSVPPTRRLAADLDAHVETLARLDGELGSRARVVLDRLAPWLAVGRDAGAVMLHGDASADQVLVDEGTGELRLTDFDRLTAGPAARDLGSLVATGVLLDLPEESTPALLDAYGEHRALPEAGDLAAWTLVAHLQRVTEPLRRGDPDWRGGIAARLTRMESTWAS